MQFMFSGCLLAVKNVSGVANPNCRGISRDLGTFSILYAHFNLVSIPKGIESDSTRRIELWAAFCFVWLF